MKFNNRKKLKTRKNIYKSLLVISILAFIIIVSTPLLNEAYGMIKYSLLLFCLLLIIYLLNADEYFEYDSTGEVIIIKNDSLVKKSLFPHEVKTHEFPKTKLKRCRVINFYLFKTLYIYLHSKSDGTTKLKFNITPLSRKRASYLRQSLDKIIIENNSKT